MVYFLEIKDSKILSEFHDCIPKSEGSSQDTQPQESSSYTVGFKKRRVGVPTKPNVLGASGLQLLSQRCPLVEELEIGYSSK